MVKQAPLRAEFLQLVSAQLLLWDVVLQLARVLAWQLELSLRKSSCRMLAAGSFTTLLIQWQRRRSRLLKQWRPPVQRSWCIRKPRR